ncbi:glycosyltransferase N-terminal domain-containing protein [Flavobacterium sp.]|uniref:3-deoxy-D-manno-octulosonic acid transferase n=1 Tax=Flavobacterium sp. TaxID=239 RepID=UPI00263371D7|nr:glycosyltransferase N-terminal domain-containing protein [Flavobacterium sp.]
MQFAYSLLIRFVALILPLLARFNAKLQRFVEGRKSVWDTLEKELHGRDNTLWFHAASLGEYEQGLPVMEQIKLKYPNHTLVLTFFSPSGYEVRKNNTVANITVYLPLDTPENAHRFLQTVRPQMAFFIKYEFWPNYLKQLRQQAIPTFLISGVFRPNQVFFKVYGGFYRNALRTFTHFFVQNNLSKTLLQSIGIMAVSVSGDTRFDRVNAVLQREYTLDFMEQYTQGATTIVIGSSWPKDEELLAHYINEAPENLKFVLAPHNIKTEQLNAFEAQLKRPSIRYSQRDTLPLKDFAILIVDTVGLLTKIYAYADIAYVGGGFGHPGVHNVLEPATFGIPIVVGPHYEHFAEATALVHLGGCVSISNESELKAILDTWITNSKERKEKGNLCATFVQKNTGATEHIVSYITTNYIPTLTHEKM